MKKTLNTNLSFTILVLIVIAVTAFLFMNRPQQQKTTIKKYNAILTPTPITLKKYYDTTYKFQIEYLSSLNLRNSSDCTNNLYQISLGTKSTNMMCDDEFSILVNNATSKCEISAQNIILRKQITIDSHPAQEIIIKNPRGTDRNETYVTFSNDNNCFTITNREQKLSETTFQQILNSFKFDR